ncbi:hypothetical protein BCR37DRAFT_395991 [Protomyces lactucae-debilis]|uniref:Anaphase-promoting complex subunit 5 n=1 Tax=Protomyces lactucae-debilis TaxID=2754530 RepID=A0A1Y2EP86_PROLT|nr:uncharacterized protein BCR37DRAFT_395991 [Protomyces lactucae-debilis]ORY73393.1 hypothetical protein BCR37DRAFT_395991 [Protomyces lactucae-debilis]
MVDRQDLAADIQAWEIHQDPLTAESLLERLFDAAAATFHDPAILRSIVLVLGALRRYDECVLAMRAYLQICLHAYKTSGSVDAQLLATTHHAVTFLGRAAREDLPKAEMALEFAQTVQAVVKDVHVLGRATFLLCLQGRKPWSECISLLSPSCELALAHIALGCRQKALGVIKELLKHSNNQVLLILGNLLCAEEQYDRAAKAFAQVTSGETLSQKRQVIFAQLALVDLVAQLDGPDAALAKAKDVFVTFTQLFGAQQTTPSIPVIVEPSRDPPRSQPASNHRSSSFHLGALRSQPSLLLRKSASSRSLVQRHRHVSAPVQLQELLNAVEEPREESPLATQQREINELIASCWLRVARYAAEVDERGDALQALSEAQTISGATSQVLLAQCRLNIKLGNASPAQIESRFEVLLQRDDGDEHASLAYATYLMDRTEPAYARAYDLLAPWTSYKQTLDAQLWLKFGQLCEARHETERAQEAYWRALELAEVEGVLPWTELLSACAY